METTHRSRFNYANVAATLAVVIALGFTPAAAHITNGFNHLWGDHIKPKLSTPGEVNSTNNPLHWTKLKGVPAGIADGVDDGTALRTAITANGTPFSQGPGFVSVERLSTGNYRLVFDRDVTICDYLATDTEAAGEPGFIQALSEDRMSDEPSREFMVRLLTYSTSGVAQDRAFYFAAFC